jgi:diaminopimelate epimerase
MARGALCAMCATKVLTTKECVRVKVQHGEIELQMNADGRVTVNMGAPCFEKLKVPFQFEGLQHKLVNDCQVWHLPLKTKLGSSGFAAGVDVAVLSMGNPHAVQVVDSVDAAPVLTLGPLIENHSAFPNRVNAGFMQVLSRNQVRLRVFERGAGETLACGTGACAAVVAGIRMGLLNPIVDVQTHGGVLTIEWQGGALKDVSQPVLMTGPATSVFEGEIDVPELP